MFVVKTIHIQMNSHVMDLSIVVLCEKAMLFWIIPRIWCNT